MRWEGCRGVGVISRPSGPRPTDGGSPTTDVGASPVTICSGSPEAVLAKDICSTESVNLPSSTSILSPTCSFISTTSSCPGTSTITGFMVYQPHRCVSSDVDWVWPHVHNLQLNHRPGSVHDRVGLNESP